MPQYKYIILWLMQLIIYYANQDIIMIFIKI